MKRTFLVSCLAASIAATALIACGEDANDVGDEPGPDAAAGVDSGETPAVDSGATPAVDSGAGEEDASDSGKSGLSFFVTSMGSGAMGGNLGGLAGADMKCQTLAAAVGAGARTWRAYLSTNTNNGGTLVNAKDRIGAGPWYNQKNELVAQDVAALHAADVPAALILDENGATVPTSGPNQHDILTGTNADGTAHTNGNCRNWTSILAGAGTPRVVGHSDSTATAANPNDRWNFAHQSNGCSQANITASGGNGRIYCFAAD